MSSPPVSSAVFIDRDGVLCDNRATYVKEWGEFDWIPGAQEGMRVLARLELPIVMVTNQSAVNRGLTTLRKVHDIHARMRSTIQHTGGRLDAIYYCPHRPEEECACRKPGLLLFHKAATELGLDLTRSYLIGDNFSDLQAGWDLGLQVVLVRTGLGLQTAAQLDAAKRQVVTVQSVLEAAHWIEATHKKDDSYVRPREGAIGTLPARRVR